MKNIHILIILVIGFVTVSCERSASAIDGWYYIYIDGDTGRTVDISYLEREKGVEAQKNIIVKKTVTLPFFVEVHTVEFLNKLDHDFFLEVKTDNDSTTKALIFDDGLMLDQTCKVFMVWSTENAVNECSYCSEIRKDSVLRYLKSINYPCYMEFSKGETSKKVRLYDWWYKDSK